MRHIPKYFVLYNLPVMDRERARTVIPGRRSMAHSFARHRHGLLAPGGLVIYPLAYPAHDWDGHAVAQRLVARAVRAISGGFSPKRDSRVVIREALKAFAFARGDAAYPGMLRDNQRISFHPAGPCALIGRAGTCYCWSDRRTDQVMMFVISRAAFAHAPGQGLRYGSRRGSRPATASKARIKGSGNVRPRCSARRRIPAQAAVLKKYLAGIGPASRTRDNEDTAAALGQSEILGIEDSPSDCPAGAKHITSVCPPSPWRFQLRCFAGQCAQKASESVSPVGENSGHVFPNNESWC